MSEIRNNEPTEKKRKPVVKTSRVPVTRIGNYMRFRKLKCTPEKPKRLYIVTTWVTWVYSLFLFGFAIVSVIGGIGGLVASDGEVGEIIILPLIILFGFFLLKHAVKFFRKMMYKQVFDLEMGDLLYANTFTGKISTERSIRLDSIIAVQLLSKSWKGGPVEVPVECRGAEINLVFKDGSRLQLIDNKYPKIIKEEAELLAQFLNVKLRK